MPIRAKRELICKRCGGKFFALFNDAIMPDDTKRLKYPLCRKCKIILSVSHQIWNEVKNNGGKNEKTH